MTREEAIDKLIYSRQVADDEYQKDWCEALDMAIKALEQEPCNTDTCKVVKAYMNEWDKPNNSDAISRQAVLDIVNNPLNIRLDEIIKQLPPVTPQPMIGHWILVSDGYGDNAYICECSECKDTVWVYKDADRKWNYCPNCGAKMVQESEEV